jgi:Protein of unknown function (DUF4125)
MLKRTTLLNRIIEAELDMFQTVSTCGPNRCLEHPRAFQLHREAQFAIFSDATLNSYLDDIEAAKKDHVNLMTIKYARMDRLIPCYNNSPLVGEVADIMVAWQLQLEEKYPDLMQRARPVTTQDDDATKTSFETYLKGELETYSEKTLSLLLQDLHGLEEQGKNGSEEIYRHLVRSVNQPTKQAD